MGINRPYIGVTGVETPAQADALLSTYAAQPNGHRLLMLGALVSYKTLAGIAKDEMLSIQQVETLYNHLKTANPKNTLFALHFFTRPFNEVSGDVAAQSVHVLGRSLSSQVEMLIEKIYTDYDKSNPSFQLGIQLNLIWPWSSEVAEIKKRFPKLKIILQVSKFDGLIEHIPEYKSVDYFLIDASRGMGFGFSPDESAKLYTLLRSISNSAVGLAGGLSEENVEAKVRTVISHVHTTDFSIDAQGKLRTGTSLDIDKASAFLRNGMRALTK